MAPKNYYFGRFRYLDIDGKVWSSPPDTVGLWDWRDIASQALPGSFGDYPVGFFAVNGTLDSTYDLIASGDLREINTDAAMLSLFETHTGYRPSGDKLIDLCGDLWTNGSSPDGMTPTRTLQPKTNGILELLLSGHLRVWNRRYQYGENTPYNDRLKTLHQHIFRDRLDEVRGGHVSIRTLREQLGFLLRKLRLKDSDWREFVRLQDQSEINGPLKPETTVTDDFNRADESLDVGNWTEVGGGNLSVISNEVGPASTFAFPDGSGRFDSDLSGDDHYAQIDWTTENGNNSFVGACVRFSASAETYYLGFSRINGARHSIRKVVAGTQTELANNAVNLPTLPVMLYLESDGSSLDLKNDAVSRLTTTDSSIAGNVRGGLLLRGEKTTERGDNFEAADLIVSARKGARYLILTGEPG